MSLPPTFEDVVRLACNQGVFKDKQGILVRLYESDVRGYFGSLREMSEYDDEADLARFVIECFRLRLGYTSDSEVSNETVDRVWHLFFDSNHTAALSA